MSVTEETQGISRRTVLRSAAVVGVAGASFALAGPGTAFAAPMQNGASSSTRLALNLNNAWAFWREDVQGAERAAFDDSKWAGVSAPHTMRLERKRPTGYNDFQGVGWYRKYFTLSQEHEGRRVTIQFDGVQKNSTVFLNGEKLTDHFGGYLGFSVDVTDKVSFTEENILAVRVGNLDDLVTPPGKPKVQLGFLAFGGMYRNVTLHISDLLRISDPIEADRVAGGGVFVTFPTVSTASASVQIKTHVENGNAASADAQVRTLLYDTDGKVVGKSSAKGTIDGKDSHDFVQTIEVKRPELWHPDSPYLYRVVTQVLNGSHVVDEQSRAIGIRHIEFKSDGFYINGSKLFLRGANCHQNFAYVGDAAPVSMGYREALRLKIGGFNSVRAAHYPHDPAFLDAADELGLLVVECETGWQFWNNDQTFVDRTYQDVVQMIRRDRNHPSVILWEVSLNETQYPEWWAKEVTRLAHAEMPGNQMFTAADFGTWGEYYDVNYKVVNTDGSDPAPSMPSFTREWGDWEDAVRKSRTDGEGALVGQVVRRQRYLEGSGYWDWGGLDANPRMGGYFLWVFEDYGTNDSYQKSGVVDIDRYPKYCYYWLKSMQDARNCQHGGPMVRIASNYSESSSRDIMVFSNAEKVRLYQNGTLVGEKTRAGNAATAPNVASKGGSPYYTFPLAGFTPGALTAEAYVDGKVAATHVVNTPGQAHHLVLEVDDAGVGDALSGMLAYFLGDASPAGLAAAGELVGQVRGSSVEALIKQIKKSRKKALSDADAGALRTYAKLVDRIQPTADGSDLIPVFIKVVDADGTIVPTSDALLHISVSGEGSLVGTDIPRIAVESQKAQAGIGYALVSASTVSGNITINAASDGLPTGQLTVATQPYGERFVSDGTHSAWQDISTLENLGAGNVALFKTATASASQPGNIPDNAVDDDDGSRWVGDGSGPAWWQVDLGEEFDLGAFQIVWESDRTYYQYEILTSNDGSTWTTAVDQKSNTSKVPSVTHEVSLKTRYVRVNIPSAGSLWPCIREFRAVPPGGTGGPPSNPGPIIDRAHIAKVSASSFAPGFEPEKAFDGTTIIGSGWSAANTTVPQSLTAELTSPITLQGIKIHWGKDSSWYTYNLDVSSDGQNWSTVINEQTRSGQYLLAETVSAANVRFARISVTNVSGGAGQSVVGIAEVVLYGTTP